jgi:hypothetical protein
MPAVDEAVVAVVPEGFRTSTSLSAAAILALASRVEDEHTAVVTDDEVIELYGEYRDARGFLTRVESRFEAIRADLDDDVRGEVAEELGVLRTELETAATPDDVVGSVDALEELLAETVNGGWSGPGDGRDERRAGTGAGPRRAADGRGATRSRRSPSASRGSPRDGTDGRPDRRRRDDSQPRRDRRPPSGGPGRVRRDRPATRGRRRVGARRRPVDAVYTRPASLVPATRHRTLATRVAAT